MELYRLKGLIRVPDTEVGNMLAGNHAIIEVEGDVKYGVAIVSNSPHDLHHTCSTLILPHTKSMPGPPTTTAPLPAQKGTGTVKVTAGYGPGCVFAFQFSLPLANRRIRASSSFSSPLGLLT